MLVYVDESGDPGMKFKTGTSAIFVICAILFDSERDAKCCSARIDEIRKQLGFVKGVEFHFNRSSRETRLEFLRGVCDQHFRYFSFALNKRRLHSDGFEYPRTFYKVPVKYAFQ